MSRNPFSINFSTGRGRHMVRIVLACAGIYIGLCALPYGAAAQPGGTLSPPVGGSAANAPSSALPQGATNPRAPGMMLNEDEAAAYDPANPFSEPPPTRQRSPEEIEAEIRDRAFTAAITGLLPLNPGEIRKLLQRYDETLQAVEIPVYPYPKPEIVVETVALDPGVAPPVIKTGVGHVTTLNVMDVTGQPWPIQDVTWAGNFQIEYGVEGTHVIRVTPLSEFAYGNISVQLVELNTPVTFTLKTQRDVVQYRFDARIPEYGPYAAAPLIDGGLELVAGGATINDVLDGVPPQGAIKLTVSGVDGRTTAYSYNDVTYVRTPLTLLSPGWSNSVSSADGMNVYTVANAPVLLLSDRGRVVRARLSEKGDENE